MKVTLNVHTEEVCELNVRNEFCPCYGLECGIREMTEREKGEDQKGQTSDGIYDGRDKCNISEERVGYTPNLVPWYPSLQYRPYELPGWLCKKDRETNPDKSQRCGTPHDLLAMGREIEIPCNAVNRPECNSCAGGEVEELSSSCPFAVESVRVREGATKKHE